MTRVQIAAVFHDGFLRPQGQGLFRAELGQGTSHPRHGPNAHLVRRPGHAERRLRRIGQQRQRHKGIEERRMTADVAFQLAAVRHDFAGQLIEQAAGDAQVGVLERE